MHLLPKLVTRFIFRARYPSRKSVSDAVMNNAMAMVYRPETAGIEITATNMAVNSNRSRVSLFGRFMAGCFGDNTFPNGHHAFKFVQVPS